MKKFFLFCLTFAASVTVYAANIKMVTYFPVPYASYQNLDVEKTLDVGVMSCAMNLTCPSNQYALNVYEDAGSGSSVLKKGYLRVTSGALNFNSSGKAVSNVMTVGNHSGTGGELDFNQSLRIASLSNRGESLQAVNEGNTVSALHMFPDHINNNFPACSGVEGAPDVSWQRLELGAKDGKAVSNVFLVCGKPKGGEAEPEPEKDCSDYEYKNSHKSECCPSASKSDTDCYYQTSTYKWESGADGFTMAGTFGSNWISQACEKNCWRGSSSTDCGKGGDLFEGVFSNSNVVVKGSQKYENHTCSQSVCDQGWYQSYTCDSSHKGMRFVHLYGYLGGPQGTTFLAYCPTKGSGQSPSWNGSMSVWTCKETQTTNKNGW